MSTGFLGTSILLDTLSDNGLEELAYTILLGHGFPGWLYSVDQGATTIWERWNSYTHEKGFGPVGMNSFNHYAYGSVVGWLYHTAAGIASDSANPGFKNIIMRPKFDRRLGFVKAKYRSRVGVIKSEWKYVNDKWVWSFTIPEGATADVMLPHETVSKRYSAGSYTLKEE
jgi:alpha-L-rhamnosidase